MLSSSVCLSRMQLSRGAWMREVHQTRLVVFVFSLGCLSDDSHAIV
jgi:hypothetical protein